MGCLPNNCIPYKGSNSEKQRQERFRYQHPSHDTSLVFCHEMPELEKKRFVKFGERRVRKFFGVGKVSITAADADKVMF